VWPNAHHPQAILGASPMIPSGKKHGFSLDMAWTWHRAGCFVGELHMKHQHQQEDIHKDAVPQWVNMGPTVSIK
jgi:hypothetical protein